MVLLDEQSTRRTETAVIAISSTVFALCLQIYGYTRPWYDWGRIASLPISAGFAITGLVLAQDDIRSNRRQKQTQSVNDDIYSCGLEVYRTQTIEELTATRQTQPDYYMGEVLTVDALPQPEPETLELYDWNNIIDDASGCLVAGPSGYGKTSLGAGFLVGMLTQSEPAEVLVLDIHASKNRIWKDLGFPRVVDDAREIYHIAEWLIGEIETRKKQDRHNIIVLLDEVNDLLSELEHMDGKKNGDRVKALIYCIRKLSNGRKFGVTLIVFGQSHNCEAIGIDGKFRNNFSLILVGETARYEMLQECKKDSLEYQTLKHTAYPCAVSGNLPLKIAQHPTHGEYTKYKKKGNPPKNLVQPKFITQGSLIPDFGLNSPPQEEEVTPPNHIPNPSDFNLEKEPEPTDKKVSEGEALAVKILEWCISKGGEITLRDLKKNTRWAENYSDELLLSAFSALQENSLAKYIIEEKTAGKISHILRTNPPK
jgi:hypothetical protein